MHGVVKATSTTTKLRVVFNASAKSSSGYSLNDQSLPGPNLYPLLSSVINKFRTHQKGMTAADISKMFREVGLDPTFTDSLSERKLTAARLENELAYIWSDFLSFLASQVLRRAASDYRNDFPRAARVIDTTFYVDDCLTGAPTVSETLDLRMEFNNLLNRAGMTLRKRRSNSSDLLISIPEQLKETFDLLISTEHTLCHKTLGIYWDTKKT